MFIGIDDTDSERGLCTTYLAAVLMERLLPLGQLVGLPKLIRLNPCARYKTRGNAAIAIELESDRIEAVRDVALQTVLDLSDFSGMNTNPGLVIAPQQTPQMTAFYQRAVTQILEIKDAKKLLDEQGIWHRGFKKGRGLIGALAAIGAVFPDYTYELITYRERARWGTPRLIDAASVWEADALTYPRTWDTVDHHNNRIVFSPHSADPVLFGIRGSDPQAIRDALDTIKSEPIERSVLYQTNQGTDAHIRRGFAAHVRACESYRLRGIVAGPPQAIAGGHLFFPLQDVSGRIICAAFEPTKNFRAIIKQLIVGDELEVYGSVQDRTLNLEKINVLHLADKAETSAPVCPQCNKRMKSAGKGQGYRCRSCKTHAEGQVSRLLARNLQTGYYEVPPCARRHLSKPLVRMIGEKAHCSR
ncbi:MAG: tRNA(Ile2) 2-agmatinylcytidine synthetase TiaS [Methanosaeta sp. PtaU1.Bin112]|nr:MAG: tRNA(Ile2) 2-agmatinylcytidine synthetase TiaS [Methanosaeta sp. PtaU1.Bin112]